MDENKNQAVRKIMAENRNALDELTDFLGVESEYTDIFGQRHEASLRAKEAVVRAMTGRKVLQNPHDVLMELLEDHATRVVEPVNVVELGQPVEIALILRLEYENDTAHWLLHAEDGQKYQGTARLVRQEKSVRSCAKGYGLYRCLLSILPALGYHNLELTLKGYDHSLITFLIVTPSACYLPASDKRFWGISAQVYAQRSLRNWGMGDLSDVVSLVEMTATAGAGFLGVNPMCSLFYARPEHISPYSPSSRFFFQYLYLDIPAIPEFFECAAARELFESEEFQTRLRAVRSLEFVDYLQVAAAKKQVLELLYDHFVLRHLYENTNMAMEFRSFQRQGGEKLYNFGVFEALHEHFLSVDSNNWGWPVWPGSFRDRKSQAVAAFSKEHKKRVEFFQYLQWRLHLQLSGLRAVTDALSMELGLYFDLPVGSDGAGFDVWYEPELFAIDISIGAPSDEFNPKGQNWGLPPMIPQRLQEMRYGPFIEVLRANMRYASILRIDHVMSLMRLFWIPRGMGAEDGVYVHYPMQDLMGIVALESQRNQCVIVGEDLGTVPDEFRQAMRRIGMLSYRIFYFERKAGHFLRPEEFPEQALVTVTSHDLPTLRGYCDGRDMDLKAMLGLFPSEELRLRQIYDRKHVKQEIAALFNIELQEFSMDLVQRLYAYLAECPSILLLVQLEDLMGQLDQVNLPGTVQEYPNWRRRLPYSIEELAKRLNDGLSWLKTMRK
ncbi:MAG: 4-alpha-glucanotransferase [Dissulfuribacterales bacterium]